MEINQALRDLHLGTDRKVSQGLDLIISLCSDHAIHMQRGSGLRGRAISYRFPIINRAAFLPISTAKFVPRSQG